jgi:prepilin-type N-terminal cleavage/methylation domain-containing protein
MRHRSCPSCSGRPRPLRTPHFARRTSNGFTLIEIAISLAVIGFALVAIIGILPTAMNVQKENRQETIIDQDASVLLNALRNGERGLDDLTNYVMAITNYVRDYNRNWAPLNPHIYGYTYTSSSFDGGLGNFAITNGYRILGLLATPKITPSGSGFRSNHVVAFVRSMSGPASEKFPQTNSSVQELSLRYKMICDVTPYTPTFFNSNFTNFNATGINAAASNQAFYNFRLVTNYQANLHEVRLTFLWPYFPNGGIGPGRQVFRTTVGGSLVGTNDFNTPLFFFQPRTYN